MISTQIFRKGGASMDKLQTKTLTLDSREVAKMVDRRHGNLVRW